MTKMRWIVGSLLVSVGALCMGGCYYDFSDDRDRAPTAAPDSYGGRGGSGPGSSAPPVTTSRWTGRASDFRGDMGAVRGFGGVEATVAGSEYGTQSSTVRLDAENTSARWWAMMQFSVSGSLRHPSLVPGAHMVFTARDRAARPTTGTGAGATPLFMSVLGCSGPRLNNYTYDRPADELTVDVSAGPSADTRQIAFDAVFAGPSGPQHVTGSFVYETR